MKRTDLLTTAVPAYYQKYIDKVDPDVSLSDGFDQGTMDTQYFFREIPDEKLDDAYAEGKWTIKEVLQHIIDTERIFMYRCLRISRGDKTAIEGFDQNIYIKSSHAEKKSLEDLLDEYLSTRLSSISLISSLEREDLDEIGVASGQEISAAAIAFIVLGHEIWHIDIIKERYL